MIYIVFIVIFLLIVMNIIVCFLNMCRIQRVVFITPLKTYQGCETNHLIDYEIRHVIEFNYVIDGIQLNINVIIVFTILLIKIFRKNIY